MRGFAYYTGTIFHLYAKGPGEAIGAGGRYDELLARFGTPMQAMGFAFDLDRLAWALRSADVAGVARAPRGGGGRGGRRRRADRAAPGAGHPGRGGQGSRDGAFVARAWGFSHVIDGASLLDVDTR